MAPPKKNNAQLLKELEEAKKEVAMLTKQSAPKDEEPKVKNDETIRCKQCSIRISKKNIARHVASVHKKLKRFECESCPKSFTTKINLQNHMDKCDGGGKNEYDLPKAVISVAKLDGDLLSTRKLTKNVPSEIGDRFSTEYRSKSRNRQKDKAHHSKSSGRHDSYRSSSHRGYHSYDDKRHRRHRYRHGSRSRSDSRSTYSSRSRQSRSRSRGSRSPSRQSRRTPSPTVVPGFKITQTELVQLESLAHKGIEVLTELSNFFTKIGKNA